MPEPIRSFGYLGWTGFANMGDEAIHQAVAGAVPEVELVPVPLGPVGLLRAAGRLRALRRSPLLLGGGTVVGRRIWRLHLHQALALSARVPPHMIGVGVEDPSFARAGHLSDAGSWPDGDRSWADSNGSRYGGHDPRPSSRTPVWTPEWWGTLRFSSTLPTPARPFPCHHRTQTSSA